MEKGQLHNLRDLVEHAAQSFGERDAYRYLVKKDVVSKSFLDLQRDTRTFGAFLKERGMERAHVAILGPTSYPWICAYLGTVSDGGVAVPLDKELEADDICELINRSKADMFVYDASYEDVARQVKRKCANVRVLCSMQPPRQEQSCADACLEDELKNARQEQPVEIDENAMCAILFTSGTTGKSKGVMLSNANLIDNTTCDDMGIEQGADNVLLSVLPIHHAYCFTCDILLGLYLGATVCVNDSILHLTRNLQVFQPNFILMVPMMLQSMYYKINEAVKKNAGVPAAMVAKQALGGKLTTIFSGGAYLDPSLVEKYEAIGIEVVEGYGMTEYSPRISSNHFGRKKAGSVGELVRGCEARIEDGELLVRGSSRMLGYYDDEKATGEALTDGWLRTGDLCHFDEDGFLHITGRKKNLIILSNGENVSPEELENMIYENPLVAEALVYDENHLITAEMFPNAEYAAAAGITDINAAMRQIIDNINDRLPAYKRIASVKLREIEFEKTTSRKIKRQYH